ncbi:hypothetical protein IG631_01528 [Alternaria alternata]|nr:hypothetical protein IG631_01528 [Alternaria alternata]
MRWLCNFKSDPSTLCSFRVACSCGHELWGEAARQRSDRGMSVPDVMHKKQRNCIRERAASRPLGSSTGGQHGIGKRYEAGHTMRVRKVS